MQALCSSAEQSCDDIDCRRVFLETKIATWIDTAVNCAGVPQEPDSLPEATVADVHYKICDCGTYTLLDANREAVAKAEGYVIEMMCPEPNGYGDYVIMKIGPDGTIANWAADFKEFENADDDD